MYPKHYKTNLTLLVAFFIFTIVSLQQSFANEVDEPQAHPAIPLLDEDGNHVLDSKKPYSAKKSCEGCHDYEKITHAYHFETGRDEADDDFGKQSGLLNLVSPGYFGGYNCMGSNAPDALAKKFNAKASGFSDYGAAGYVQRCGNCHAGGGWMEKDRDGVRYDKKDMSTVPALDGDYYNRGTNKNNEAVDDKTLVSKWNWHKSGVVENDCLLCHVDFSKNLKSMNPLLGEIGSRGVNKKPRDLVRELRGDGLIKVGHFRYGGSAMLEFLNLNMSNDASKNQTLLRNVHETTSLFLTCPFTPDEMISL